MMGWRWGLRSAAVRGVLVIPMLGAVAPVAVVMAASARWASRLIGPGCGSSGVAGLWSVLVLSLSSSTSRGAGERQSCFSFYL